MKRTFALLMVICMIATMFAGCGQQSSTPTEPEKEQVSTNETEKKNEEPAKDVDLAFFTGKVETVDLLDEIIDRYGDPPKGVLNLIDIALLRAKAREVGIKDIRQKAGDVLFTLANLNFEVVSALCADEDYSKRVTFLANAKEPTLRLTLSKGVDSLKQSKIFVEHYRSYAAHH